MSQPTAAMQDLLDKLAAGTHRLYISARNENKYDLYQADADGRTWGGRGVTPVAAGLVARGLVIPGEDRELVLPAKAETPAGAVELTVVNEGRGEIRVHGRSCADLKRARTDAARWDLTASSRREVVFDIYPPDQFEEMEQDGSNWRDLAGDVTFLPCCGDLPAEPAPVPAVELEPAPAALTRDDDLVLRNADGRVVCVKPADGTTGIDGMKPCGRVASHRSKDHPHLTWCAEHVAEDGQDRVLVGRIEWVPIEEPPAASDEPRGGDPVRLSETGLFRELRDAIHRSNTTGQTAILGYTPTPDDAGFLVDIDGTPVGFDDKIRLLEDDSQPADDEVYRIDDADRDEGWITLVDTAGASQVHELGSFSERRFRKVWTTAPHHTSHLDRGLPTPGDGKTTRPQPPLQLAESSTRFTAAIISGEPDGPLHALAVRALIEVFAGDADPDPAAVAARYARLLDQAAAGEPTPELRDRMRALAAELRGEAPDEIEIGTYLDGSPIRVRPIPAQRDRDPLPGAGLPHMGKTGPLEQLLAGVDPTQNRHQLRDRDGNPYGLVYRAGGGSAWLSVRGVQVPQSAASLRVLAAVALVIAAQLEGEQR